MWLTTNWIYSYNKLQLWFIPQPQRSQQTPSELVNPEDTSQFTRISQTITTRKRTRISCLRECNYVGTMTWISPGMVMATTFLLATTQLCTDPIEMENREAPRQHDMNQDLLPLHPRWLEGRTDSDTFFASEKRIRHSFTFVLWSDRRTHMVHTKTLRM